MGMVLALTTLADRNIDRLLADPPLVWKVIAREDPDVYVQARRDASKTSFLGALFGGKKAPPPDPEPLVLAESEGIETDVDKAWHGIHYLLTGTADEGQPPWSFLVSGGRDVGDLDVGYGPARVFTAAETKAIYEALSSLTEDDLRSRFNPADMTAKEIYPEIWSRGSPDEETIGYLIEYFRLLRGFLQQAVDAAVGMVVVLC